MEKNILKPPFKWENRQVLIQDRVWYVPEYYSDYASFAFPGWSSEQLFGNDRPVHIEYCSGNGHWIVEKALERPDLNWVAVEKLFKRAKMIWKKVNKMNLPNVVVICGEGHAVTHHYIPDGSVEHVYVNFPDPWPKNRHAKHRIIQPGFLAETCRILKKEGKITFVTDDPAYSAEAIDHFLAFPGFDPCYPSPFYVSEKEGYGSSWFEELWRKKGCRIHYHEFSKRDRA